MPIPPPSVHPRPEHRGEPRFAAARGTLSTVIRGEGLVAYWLLRDVSKSGLRLFAPELPTVGDFLALYTSVAGSGSQIAFGTVVRCVPSTAGGGDVGVRLSFVVTQNDGGPEASSSAANVRPRVSSTEVHSATAACRCTVV